MMPQQIPQVIAGPDAQPAAGPARHMPRLPVLDGWRGLSIALVVACHVIPMGPAPLALNVVAGLLGMTIFFCLSGFLIVSTLYFDPSLYNFTVRRLARILPLAWLFILLIFPFAHATPAQWRANLLFYANLLPNRLVPVTGHLWSLCIEVQFYLFIGVIFRLLRYRAFVLLPVACLAITALRIVMAKPYETATYLRGDEILAGAVLAWLLHDRRGRALEPLLARLPPFIPIAFLFLSCSPSFLALNYLRPYFTAISIGATLFYKGGGWARFLHWKPLSFLASISYALYVWHPIFAPGCSLWPDDVPHRYPQVVLGIPVSLLVAYLSTAYFERPWINLGKRMIRLRRSTPALDGVGTPATSAHFPHIAP